MQFFPVGKIYDFMGKRKLFLVISSAVTLFAVVMLITPGPNLGTDFKGGTEIEVEFKSDPGTIALGNAVIASGFSAPDVIRVAENGAKNRYLIRVQEVTVLSDHDKDGIRARLCLIPESGTAPAGSPS